VVVRPVAVGSFVLGGLGLAVVAVLVFGGMRVFTRTVPVIVVFQGSVAGLAVGSPVTFRGVQIGSVARISVHVNGANEDPVIPVVLDLDPSRVSWPSGRTMKDYYGLKHAIDLGLRAQLSSVSLVTGQMDVELDFLPGTPAKYSDPSAAMPEIPTAPSDLEHLKDQLLQMNLPQLANSARSALVSAQQVLNRVEGKIDPLTDSIQRVASSAQTTLDTATAALRSVQADAARTLSSVTRLADDTRQQVTMKGRALDPVVASAAEATANANQLLISLNGMLGQGAPMRGNLEASLRDLAASASSLRDLTRNLQRNPGGTLFGKAGQ
jgi:paraquat-inducible protein B